MGAPLTEKNNKTNQTTPQENPHFAYRIAYLLEGNQNMLSFILSNTKPRFLSLTYFNDRVIDRHGATMASIQPFFIAVTNSWCQTISFPARTMAGNTSWHQLYFFLSFKQVFTIRKCPGFRLNHYRKICVLVWKFLQAFLLKSNRFCSEKEMWQCRKVISLQWPLVSFSSRGSRIWQAAIPHWEFVCLLTDSIILEVCMWVNTVNYSLNIIKLSLT